MAMVVMEKCGVLAPKSVRLLISMALDFQSPLKPMYMLTRANINNWALADSDLISGGVEGTHDQGEAKKEDAAAAEENIQGIELSLL